MKSYENPGITNALDLLAKDINDWAVRKGFWTRPTDGLRNDLFPEDEAYLTNAEKGQKLMLVVSELGEAVEGVRKPGPSDKIPLFTQEEEEIADAVIRLLDYVGRYRLRLAEAVEAKMAVNEGRSFRHGKAF